jgi:hypothetical protein
MAARMKFGWGSPPSSFPENIVKTVRRAITRCSKDTFENRHWVGRGIQVCQEWLDDPALFCRYLMTLPGWDDESLIIDRINNDGHYEPGNLRWTTYSVSLSNRRHYRRPPPSDEVRAKVAISVRNDWIKKCGPRWELRVAGVSEWFRTRDEARARKNWYRDSGQCATIWRNGLRIDL